MIGCLRAWLSNILNPKALCYQNGHVKKTMLLLERFLNMWSPHAICKNTKATFRSGSWYGIFNVWQRFACNYVCVVFLLHIAVCNHGANAGCWATWCFNDEARMEKNGWAQSVKTGSVEPHKSWVLRLRHSVQIKRIATEPNCTLSKLQ